MSELVKYLSDVCEERDVKNIETFGESQGKAFFFLLKNPIAYYATAAREQEFSNA